MKTRALLAICLSTLVFSMAARASRVRTSAIDDFCMAIRNEFVEAIPLYFTGPDPWEQLDRLPESLADVAVASVYYEGARVKWMVLEIQGPRNSWFEITHYFFDENGQIEKRERRLDHYNSHIEVREDQYFTGRKVIETSYHHSLLAETNASPGDKEDWDTFYDPNAPFYTSTADLPIVFLKVEFKQLAGLDKLFPLWESYHSLLKFSGPLILVGSEGNPDNDAKF